MATQVGTWAASAVFVLAVIVLILLRVVMTPKPQPCAAYEVKHMTNNTLTTRPDTLINSTLETIWTVGASGVAAYLPGTAFRSKTTTS